MQSSLHMLICMYHLTVHTCKHTHMCMYDELALLLFLHVWLHVVFMNINCPSPADAGDVAAALPNLKCLRKVTVWDMNPVPVLQTVGLCGKLQEVSVRDPKHCEVGMRCAYRWM